MAVGDKDTCIYIISASTYKHPVLKKCCYDGAMYNFHETCEQRAARVKIGPRCLSAFTHCCTMADQIRSDSSFKRIALAIPQDNYRVLTNLGKFAQIKFSKKNSFQVLVMIKS